MFKKTLALVATLFTLIAGAATACPDWRANPTFGDIRLTAGFLPDPYIRNVTAGGTINMQRCFNGGYAGFVARAPDFDLYWNGRSGQLTFAVESSADTILLINAPDGSWHYNDDYRGLNSAITFYQPLEGLYDVWIGSYDGSRRNPARLIITEYNY